MPSRPWVPQWCCQVRAVFQPLRPAWNSVGDCHFEWLRAPSWRGGGSWSNELETQRYWIAFQLTLNQAVSVLISDEKWSLGLSPSRRKLLINPPTTGYWEKRSVWEWLSLLSLHIKTSCRNQINWYGHHLNETECPNIKLPGPRQHYRLAFNENASSKHLPPYNYPHLLFLAESLVMNVASMFSAVNSRNPPSGTLLDLLSVLRKKNWLILKLNVGICCYSKPGPWLQQYTMLSVPPPVCGKWRQAVVKWEMQNSQSVCLFNVTGNISC